jgi:adenine-specific DNA-methyltransferase
MVKYSCERCFRDFSQKSHYDSHMRRKTPCENNNDKLKLLVDKTVEDKLHKNNIKSVIPNIIDDDYEILKKYYNNNLNNDKELVKTSNDEPTPIDCVEEMINKIPDHVFENPNLKWLDPCCGCGNFFIVIYYKLLKYHSREYILTNMLYFNDINTDRLEIVKKIFCSDKIRLNITIRDYLEYEIETIYDFIVANPPYAKLLENGKRASKNHNMIGSFIKKSFEILNKGGHLLFITPDNWMSKSDRNTLIKDITSKQIIHLNIHTAKKYFKKIGSSFTWYIIENTGHYKDIDIEGIYKKKNYKDKVKSEIRSYIPLFYNSVIQSILSKTIDDNKNQKFKVETSSDLHKYTKKLNIRCEKDEIF